MGQMTILIPHAQIHTGQRDKTYVDFSDLRSTAVPIDAKLTLYSPTELPKKSKQLFIPNTDKYFLVYECLVCCLLVFMQHFCS